MKKTNLVDLQNSLEGNKIVNVFLSEGNLYLKLKNCIIVEIGCYITDEGPCGGPGEQRLSVATYKRGNLQVDYELPQ